MQGSIFNRIPVRIILPVVLTLVLFVMTIFLLILPRFEDRLMEGKRETIRELIEVAWSTLTIYAEKEASGELSRQQAQHLAMEHIRHLRYGQDLKDYFWINDMHPRIVMHPYRPDLEGKDVSGFTDPNGKQLFMEFKKTVETSEQGYVDYEWQWMDNPNRIVPKISFVKGFKPWGWIIGTGIYVEDIRMETALFTRKLTLMCLGILVVILALSTYIIRSSIIAEKEKKQAQEKARMRQEQLFHAAKMVSLGTLVSGVAHEINNPITSVMLNTPTLNKIWQAVLPILDEYAQNHGDFSVGGMKYSIARERIPKLLADIGDGARRVGEIVTDLKDFARETPCDHSDIIDLNQTVKKAVGLVSHLIKKSTDHFTVTYDPNLPRIQGNARRIEQVIINLVMNACQALPDNGKAIFVTTGHDSQQYGVYVKIKDEGVGISQDVIQQIKDPFFTTRRDSGGTGLGLAISDKIVQDHDGQMTFSSVPGQGTEVVVWLPQPPASDAMA